jgi:hypothetical protein
VSSVLCEKEIWVESLQDWRPCLREQKHKRRHIVDLAGCRFGCFTALQLGPPYIQTNGGRQTTWLVRNENDGTGKIILAHALIHGQLWGSYFYIKQTKRPKKAVEIIKV